MARLEQVNCWEVWAEGGAQPMQFSNEIDARRQLRTFLLTERRDTEQSIQYAAARLARTNAMIAALPPMTDEERRDAAELVPRFHHDLWREAGWLD